MNKFVVAIWLIFHGKIIGKWYYNITYDTWLIRTTQQGPRTYYSNLAKYTLDVNIESPGCDARISYDGVLVVTD